MKSRERADLALRLALDTAPVMLWYGSAEGQLMFVNRAWLSYRGRNLDQEAGRGWLDGVLESERTGVVHTVEVACHEQRAFEIEFRIERADGALRRVVLNGAPRLLPAGKFGGHIGSCIDVTERRQTRPIRSVEATPLETLMGNARDMAYRLRLVPERRIEFATGAIEGITGYPPDAFLADPSLLQRAIHRDDAESSLFNLGADEQTDLSDLVLRWVHPDGRIVFAEHRRRPVFDETGRLIAVEGVARDITTLVESQARLRESEDQMRQLAARLQDAREQERTSLARELHDELGQTMTALKLEIGRAMTALNPAQLTPVLVDRLQSLMGLSEIVLSTVKRIATDLRPPALDHLGLVEAIRWEALAFKARSGLRCRVRADTGTATRLTREQQTAIFRIFQEALTNVARHAAASAVTVTIAEGKHFDLRIQDNGKGIADAEATDPRSIGLIGMRERAALIGATFTIAGRRGKGTTVSLHLPLPSSSTTHPARRRAVSPKAKRSRR